MQKLFHYIDIDFEKDYYLKINRKLLHVKDVALKRLLYIINNALNDDLTFVSRNFTITKETKKQKKCMLCNRRISNYIIKGCPEDSKYVCLCKEHLRLLNDTLVNLIYNGNLSLSNIKFKKQ